MSWLLTADLHFTHKPEDEYRFKIFRYIETLIFKEKIDHIFILGDLTDKPENHKSVLVNRICDEFFQLSQMCQIHILMGNHDCVDWSAPFFSFLQRINNIHYYSSPEIKYIDLNGENKKVILLPCTKNPETEWSHILNNEKHYDADFIFTHMLFTGSKSESGYLLEGVSPSIFNAFKKARIYSGDIHRPQQVGRVTYVGSPYYVRFGDEFHHRVLVLDGKEEKEFRPDLKRKIVLEIENIVDLDRHYVSVEDDVKVRINLTRDKLMEWDKIVKQIEERLLDKGASSVVFEPVIQENEELEAVASEDIENTDNWFEWYCKKKNIDGTLKEVGQKILEA